MGVEHHNLTHEFPEFQNQIHHLKVDNAHFRRLFNEYHRLTSLVENIENEVVPASTVREEDYKYRRVRLKDELYEMLKDIAKTA